MSDTKPEFIFVDSEGLRNLGLLSQLAVGMLTLKSWLYMSSLRRVSMSIDTLETKLTAYLLCVVAGWIFLAGILLVVLLSELKFSWKNCCRSMWRYFCCGGGSCYGGNRNGRGKWKDVVDDDEDGGCLGCCLESGGGGGTANVNRPARTTLPGGRQPSPQNPEDVRGFDLADHDDEEELGDAMGRFSFPVSMVTSSLLQLPLKKVKREQWMELQLLAAGEGLEHHRPSNISGGGGGSSRGRRKSTQALARQLSFMAAGPTEDPDAGHVPERSASFWKNRNHHRRRSAGAATADVMSMSQVHHIAPNRRTNQRHTFSMDLNDPDSNAGFEEGDDDDNFSSYDDGTGGGGGGRGNNNNTNCFATYTSICSTSLSRAIVFIGSIILWPLTLTMSVIEWWFYFSMGKQDYNYKDPALNNAFFWTAFIAGTAASIALPWWYYQRVVGRWLELRERRQGLSGWQYNNAME